MRKSSMSDTERSKKIELMAMFDTMSDQAQSYLLGTAQGLIIAKGINDRCAERKSNVHLV